MWETTFSEVMAGPARLRGAGGRRQLRLELDVTAPGLLKLWADTEATMTGRAILDGVADDASASGTMQIAPIRRRRLRYQLTFRTADDRVLRLDGWKSVSYLRPIRSMITLPATVYAADGSVFAEALLKFDLRDLPRFLGSLRYRRTRRTARVEPARV
jgi:hypothetical protein